MKLNYAPQAGLRRRKPDHGRERAAFWGGILIVVAFEVILVAKSWSELPVLPWHIGEPADDGDVSLPSAPMASGPTATPSLPPAGN